MIKKLLKNRHFRAWFSVSVTVLVLLLAITIVSSVLYDLFKIVFGREIPVFEEGYEAIYLQDAISKQDALNRANKLNEEICEEGTVLLSNDGGLPLARGAKVSVFGKNSVDLVYGGSGSGGGNNSSANTIYDSLHAANFKTNPVLETFYKDRSKSGPKRDGNSTDLDSGKDISVSTGETSYDKYSETVKASYSEYNDAALIVFSRIGGEGFDLPRMSADDEDRHYLELDPNEVQLVKEVASSGFKKVIIIINSASVMELDWVESGEYGNIDACLWIGAPGNSGINALGRILTGEVNPSGRTVDTWAVDLLSAPSLENFGTNKTANGDNYFVDGKKKVNFTVDYEEGIYVGYRYYETRGYDELQADGNSDWYAENVVYPFGYGLSYTTFSQEITGGKISQINLDKNGNCTVQLEVTVTNTGSVTGKDVVQVYVTAPYTAGWIEKSHVVLAGFAKTGDIRPGKTEVVNVSVDMYDVASFDYNDKNKNEFFGYELEEGDYVFRLAKNSHEEYESFTANLATTFKYQNDPVTEYTVTPRFEDADDELDTVLSRADWEGTYPAAKTQAERERTQEFIDKFRDFTTNNPETFGEVPRTGVPTEWNIFELVYAEDYEGYEDSRWDEIVDSLSVSDMVRLVTHGSFHTEELLSQINKPMTLDGDGPAGFTNFISDSQVSDHCVYASEVVMASTWNTDIVYRMGKSVGEEGLWGDGTSPYSGWYAPGANIHRNPFGGRNFEYFSEDGYLSGMMAAYEIKGAASKGVYCYIKHFALNEQETHRSGVATWVTEQALREIYLRPFEKAVKVGNTRGVMSSFNRIGTVWTGGDYRLLTEVLRNEWGFKGTVICDFNTNSYMDVKQMVYAGGDLNLSTTRFWNDVDANSAGDVTVLKRATRNILYTVSTSNVMNAPVKYYIAPVWVIVFSCVAVVAVIGLAVWGVFAVKGALRRIKEQSEIVVEIDGEPPTAETSD